VGALARVEQLLLDPLRPGSLAGVLVVELEFGVGLDVSDRRPARDGLDLAAGQLRVADRERRERVVVLVVAVLERQVGEPVDVTVRLEDDEHLLEAARGVERVVDRGRLGRGGAGGSEPDQRGRAGGPRGLHH
jgi:hypothetical protein